MKIISLNTWAGVLLDPLLTFFKQNKDIDIFCLQEIYKDAEGKTTKHPTLDMKLDLYAQIEKVLGDTHVGYFRPAHKDYYGQAVFVKKGIEIIEEGDVFIYDCIDPEQRGGHSRNLQYIVTSHRKEKLFIANLHGLWNGGGKTDTEDRLEQSRRIREFVDRFDLPKVIVGDFNLSPSTESLALIENEMRSLIREYGVESTRTKYYEKEEKFADYAIVSNAVNVTDFKVLSDEVSDHSPLYLEIQ